MLHNFYYPLHCKLPQFAMSIRIAWHTIQQMIKLLSCLGVTPINSLGALSVLLFVSENSLRNEAVLAAKQDSFIVLTKKYLCDH